MIDDYCGHITPVNNAERILQRIPGWEPIADGSGETADGVNAWRSRSHGRKTPKEEIGTGIAGLPE